MFTVKHPLENINSFDEIMKLPYFEFVTCFGHFCMHPGGLDKTIELFEEAGIQESDRVLEIGSGNGFTTSLLMDAGINVSVVEPNPYLLQTTLNLCFKNHKKTPDFFLTDAESLKNVPERYYQKVLLEAVFGFIKDKENALEKIHKSLGYRDSHLCIIDFYYEENPPKEVLQEFFKATGTNLETLTKGRWQEYLKDHFEFEHWSDFDLSPNKIPEVKDIIKSLKDSDLMHLVPGSGEDRFELIAKKWASYIEIFDENKKYMKGFKTILRPKR
ncbi:MAG: class I SAM-dependent methyltransferase [Bdellovibrionota bacterium]|nr:class I SAM-dependent methyltransferase [Bdellovibrionota bacterium]